MHTATAIIDRIEGDLVTLRKMVGITSSSGPSKVSTRIPAVAKKAPSGRVPVLKASYTTEAAKREKAKIDIAFEAGLIPYDKKRGMKMMVTKLTEGWSPV